ncbi:MAG: NADPH-dependent FMN reductase [Sciscionella sp.]
MTVSVVGIGGSLRPGSASERALRIALDGAAGAGADVTAFVGEDLRLPFYDPAGDELPRAARRLIERVRTADGVVLAAPGYHGTMSGLVKNALDYLEELREDERPYLDGRAVGCIGVAYGWQATVNTLGALRGVVHALRGWPTPLGAAVNSVQVKFDDAGTCSDAQVAATLRTVGIQVADFARLTPP